VAARWRLPDGQHRAGLANTVIQIGLPAEAPSPITQTERIYLTGTEALTREAAVQQRCWRESYLLPLIVEVERHGGKEIREAVEERGWAIFDEITTAIAVDDELGGTVDEAEVESVPAEVTLPLHNNDGWLTRITVSVRATALIADG
jgi:hypothetical protein